MSTVKQIQSVLNACAVVEAVAAHQPVGVSELSRLLGLDKSAAHRLAVTLHEAGWLTPSAGVSTRWELSPTFSRLARSGGEASLSVQVAPAMARLRDATGETVLLAVLDGERLMVRGVLESRAAVRFAPTVGAELPMAGSAGARVIAAHLPPPELTKLRAGHPDLFDDRTLGAVRRRGWGVNDREVDPAIRAVAAPLLADSYPVGALVVSGPVNRIDADAMRRFGQLAVEVAATALPAFGSTGTAAGGSRRSAAPRRAARG